MFIENIQYIVVNRSLFFIYLELLPLAYPFRKANNIIKNCNIDKYHYMPAPE